MENESEMSDKRLSLETFLMVKSVKETEERHSRERHEDSARIWGELKEIRKELVANKEQAAKESAELATRLTKVETEKNVWGKVLTPILGIMSGFLGGYFGKHA